MKKLLGKNNGNESEPEQEDDDDDDDDVSFFPSFINLTKFNLMFSSIRALLYVHTLVLKVLCFS